MQAANVFNIFQYTIDSSLPIAGFPPQVMAILMQSESEPKCNILIHLLSRLFL